MVVYTAIYFTLLNSYAAVVVHMNVTNSTGIYPYNVSYIRLAINNTGEKLIKGMVLNVYVNGTSKKLYRITIPTHKVAELNFTYVYPGPGNYSFSVIANPGRILNLSSSSVTTVTKKVTVLPPEAPLVMDYIPSLTNGYTKSIALSSYGVSVVPTLLSQYDIGQEQTVLQNKTGAIEQVLSKLSGIESFDGAYSSNKSLTVGQAWIRGVGPAYISSVMEGLGYAPQPEPMNISPKFDYLTKGDVSACIFFSGGWTKLVYVISNASEQCTSFVSAKPSLNSSESIISAINSSRYLSNATSEFVYANTSDIGGIIFRNATTLGIGNIFINNYGLFLSMLSKTRNYANGSYVCSGLLDDNNTICTIYGISFNSSFSNFSLVDSRLSTPNYTASIYSIVPVKETSGAYSNGVSLLEHLNISGPKYTWTSAFSDSCGFYNTSISCSVKNATASSAELNLTNKMNSTIHLNSAACYLQSESPPQQINSSLKPGESGVYNVTCTYGAVSSFAIVSNYTIALNYSINGKVHAATGYLKLSELG